MTAPNLELLGGPLDGLELPYTGEKPLGLRGYAAPVLRHDRTGQPTPGRWVSQWQAEQQFGEAS